MGEVFVLKKCFSKTGSRARPQQQNCLAESCLSHDVTRTLPYLAQAVVTQRLPIYFKAISSVSLLIDISSYYMGSSVSGQDEPNPVL